MVIAAEGRLVIRRMRDEPDEWERFAAWRNEPHVREWWDPDDPPLTPARALEQYAECTRADSTTTACIFEVDGRPAGYIEFYPWDAYRDDATTIGVPVVEDAWGLDVFVGEPDLIDRGVGSSVVDLLSRYLFDERGASRVMFAVAVENARALRAYEKAGFAREGRVLDTDLKNGQRVASWLLVRRRPEAVRIEGFTFGSIRIDGVTYEHDVVIDRGRVRKRKKKPSRPLRGAFGHTPLSIGEDIPWDCRHLVIGTGADGALPVMEEVEQEAARRGVELLAVPTSEAIAAMGAGSDGTNAILHVTC